MTRKSVATTASWAVAAAGFGLVAATGPVDAQPAAYPSQRVLVVVGFPPGGPADIVARALADGLSRRLAKPVVVENRPGGGGSAAVSNVARSEADGHTVLIAGEGPISVVPALATPPYSAMNGLVAISVFAEGGCSVVALHPSFPATNLAAFLAHAKAAPEPITYASSGLGTPSDTVAAEFQQKAGVALKRVIYRGAAPALNDLIAGHVPMMFPTAGAVAELVTSGRLRGLAVSTKMRCKVLPDVPTLVESGIPLEAGNIWFGMFAAVATPSAIVDRLLAETQAVAGTSEFAARIDALLLTPHRHKDREAADRFVKSDVEAWRQKAITIPGLK